MNPAGLLYSRNAAALLIALVVSMLLFYLQPLLLTISTPSKKEYSGEAIRLADYRRPPPPPPKREETKKKEVTQKQVQPKLKDFLPKMDAMDTSALGKMPFQFDVGLSGGGPGGVGLSLGGNIWDVSKVDAKPVPLFRAKPAFPAQARSKGITGKVAFKFLVDRDGMVKDVEIISAEPKDIFDEATINAVKQWRFQPAKVKGTAVACLCQSAITFELDTE
jgi:protein TonB